MPPLCLPQFLHPSNERAEHVINEVVHGNPPDGSDSLGTLSR